MANSDRDIVISPDRGASTDPTIRFTGADSLSSATIVLRVYNSGTDATLSFEGDVGQLLAITDSTLGSVFSVNDITGIPSIEVLDTGEIRLAQFSGFVNIPNSTNATSTGTGALRTLGGVGIARDVWIGGNVNVAGTLNAATVVGSVTTASQVAITNDNSSSSAHYLTFVSGTSGNLPIKVDGSALTFVPSTNNVGIGTTTPYTRLSIVSSSNTEGTSYFTSAYEASRQWGTRIWKNDIGGGIPLQIETQYATTWYNSLRIGHGQDNSHPSLTTFYTTHLATTGGNVGIATTSPGAPLQVRGAGAANTYRGVIRIDNTDTTNAWGGISFPDNATGADTASNNYYFIGRGGSISSRIFSIHIPTASDYGSGSQPTFGVYSTGADPLFTVQSSTGNGYFKGSVGINTTDFSYTTNDNSRLVGSNTNNKLFVNGSIQLLGNNDAIVIGRGTATFLTDEELGFGWGGGWWMNDSTYLRVRNYKHLYNENTITGSRHQGFSTSYDQPSMFMPRWEDTNWAFGMSSNNSNTYWMQVQYNGANNNTRGFRVWDNNAGVARMSVADRITTHQNTFYRTFQNYTGSDNGPVKTWDGVLIAGSDYSGAQAYTIIDTGVPQDSYMMGGFTIEWFENYSSTNAKTTIKLGGYWNPESNGGFIGWEYTTSNPNVVPTIQVCRNNSTGNTAFVLTHFSSNYAIILARDLWLGYSGGDYNYGHGWAIRQQGDLSGYSNFDTVVARAAASASGINADTLDGFDSTRFLRSVGHPGYGDWNTFGNNNPQTVMQMFQENFNIGSNTGSSNFPSPNYPYGTLINFDANSSARAQMYISHAGPDLHFRGGWGTGSWQTWHKTWNTGNDGAGSGLDADLLDGLDSTIVMRPVAAYKWDVSSNGATGRRYTIMRLYGTPNHWGAWQNIEITLTNTYFNGGYVKYYLYGYYGMGNGSSWILQVKDAGGVGTGYMRVNLGTVTYAGFTSGGQNTYYQDVYVDMDYYTSAKVTVEFYGNGYQTTTPGAESYTLTQLYTSPATTNITYSNDDKSSSYIFGNKIWNSGNDGAGSGLDADLLDGLELHTGRNNEANKVVRTDGSGYIQAGWINTTSGDLGNTFPDRVYMSNDGYLRYNTINTAKAHLGNTAKYGNSRPNITSDTNYWVGSMGWGTTDLNSVFDWGSGFWDSWSNPGNQPAGTSHWTGLQAMHYTNGTNRYGYQLTMGAGDPNLFYVRGVWGGSPTSWYKVNLLGLNQGSISNFASIYYDADDTAFYVDPANGGFNLRGGSSNRVTYFTDDSGYKVSNAEGTGIQMRLGAAWSRAGIYSNSYLDLGAESTIAWRIANSEKGYMDSSSNLIAYGSMRAPIFYDSNDTTYYLDPAADLSLRVYGEISNSNYVPGNLQPGALNIGRTDRDYGWDGTSWSGDVRSGILANCSELWEFNIHDSGDSVHSAFRYNGGNQLLMGRDIGWGTLYIEASNSFRAPIFYDSNDTGYYLDPRSASRLSGLRLDGVDNQASGEDAILWINKPNNNDWAMLVTGNLEYGLDLRMASSHSYAIRSLASGSEYSRLGSDLFYHSGSVRAPIFYDTNNTGYYIDPNDETYLYGGIWNNGAHGDSFIKNRLLSGNNGAGTGEVRLQMWCSEPGNTWDWAGFGYNVDNNLNESGNVPAYYFGRPNTSFGQSYMRFATDGNWYFYNTPNGSNTRYTTMRLDRLGYAEAYDSFRAPIFYDSNNTAYYCNPDSTSRFRSLDMDNGGTTIYIRQQVNSPGAGYTFSSGAQPAFWIESPYADYGGICMDADGTTIYGAGDSGWVFRVIDEDSYQGFVNNAANAALATCFQVNQTLGGGAYVRGPFVATGEITAYGSVSDIRRKENIVKIDNALEKISKLNGYTFNFKGDTKPMIGVIAQEVEKVFPQLVYTTDAGPGKEEIMAVRYENISAVLIEAVKEQQSKIDSLTKELEELKEFVKKHLGKVS